MSPNESCSIPSIKPGIRPDLLPAVKGIGWYAFASALAGSNFPKVLATSSTLESKRVPFSRKPE
ncbi:hypothetical protein D3C80_2236440 [compost metagenome]